MWVRCHSKCLSYQYEILNGYIFVRYFLWDALDAIINFIDAGFVAHGIACFAIFFLSYVRVSPNPFLPLILIAFFSFLFQKPFMSYYGTRVLLWELSTFFLNIHW